MINQLPRAKRVAEKEICGPPIASTEWSGKERETGQPIAEVRGRRGGRCGFNQLFRARWEAKKVSLLKNNLEREVYKERLVNQLPWAKRESEKERHVHIFPQAKQEAKKEL